MSKPRKVLPITDDYGNLVTCGYCGLQVNIKSDGVTWTPNGPIHTLPCAELALNDVAEAYDPPDYNSDTMRP